MATRVLTAAQQNDSGRKVVNFHDEDPEVVKLLLEAIYCETIASKFVTLLDCGALLKLAEKYQALKLLHKPLDLKNLRLAWAPLPSAASKPQIDPMRQLFLDRFLRNPAELRSPEVAQLCRDQPEFAVDLVRECSSRL